MDNVDQSQQVVVAVVLPVGALLVVATCVIAWIRYWRRDTSVTPRRADRPDSGDTTDEP